MRCGVDGSGVEDVGFRDWGLGLKVQGSESKGLEFSV